MEERLQLFRFSTIFYFVDNISRAEGSTDAVRREIRDLLEKKAGLRTLLERINQMSSTERLDAVSQLIKLLRIFATATRKITNQEWVTKIDKVFLNKDHNESAAVPSANASYDIITIPVFGGGPLDFLGIVIHGCNLVNMDGLFALGGVGDTFAAEIRKKAIESGRFWLVKCPTRGVELFLDCHEAAGYCRPHCLSPKGQEIIRWLDQAPLRPSPDPGHRHRFRMLEAVDSRKYVVTFLGLVPSAGFLVLLRASDGHVHVASFMKAFFGLPVTELELWDDHCLPLSDLVVGPVNMCLDNGQIGLLTIPTPTPIK